MGAAFKLETFSLAEGSRRDDRANAGAADLESLLAKARGAARAQGFEEGAAATAAAYDADRKVVLERIAEAFEDARFNAEEARRAAVSALGPLLEALVAAIAPAIARAGLGPQIAALVADAVRSAGRAEIDVRVAPDMTRLARDALDAAGVDATVSADPDLAPLEARAVWRGGYDRIDLGACIGEAEAAISAFFAEDERTGTDG